MEKTLEGRTAIITGGASGIGEAIVKKFSKNGAYVHILDSNSGKAESVVKQIIEENGLCDFHKCDVSNQTETKKIINQFVDQQAVHILVNNAGIAHIGNVENTTETDLDRLYNVNIKGVYNCLSALLPHMKENGNGCILNIASIAATVAVADRFAYSMTKGAVLSMTYSVAKDYINHSIRCNSISPARIHTPFVDNFLAENYPGKEKEMFDRLSKTQPIGRMGKPEEVAELALFLCSDKSEFITGTDFPIDGGFIKLNS